MAVFEQTTQEVKEIINKTKRKKAPAMLKNIERKGATAKVSLANAMMRVTRFPKILKEAVNYPTTCK